MTELRLTEHQRRHQSDIERIQRVLNEAGTPCGFFDAYERWVEHSDDYAAGWLGLPETDKELLEILQ